MLAQCPSMLQCLCVGCWCYSASMHAPACIYQSMYVRFRARYVLPSSPSVIQWDLLYGMRLWQCPCLVANSRQETWISKTCSILLWKHMLSPGTRWLLKFSLDGGDNARYVDTAHRMLCALFSFCWLLPVYILSFPLSCVW